MLPDLDSLALFVRAAEMRNLTRAAERVHTSAPAVSAQLKALEDENTKLKRMLADAMLDNVALKDLLGKKW